MSDDGDTCHLPNCPWPRVTMTLCRYHAERFACARADQATAPGPAPGRPRRARVSRVVITLTTAELVSRKLGEVMSQRIRRKAVNVAGASARKELPALIAETYHTTRAGVGARGKAASPGAEDPIYRLLLNRRIRIAAPSRRRPQVHGEAWRAHRPAEAEAGRQDDLSPGDQGRGPGRIHPAREQVSGPQGAAPGWRADIPAAWRDRQAPRPDRRRPGRSARSRDGSPPEGAMTPGPVVTQW